ncbi:hypothetical protein L228DRAFT_280329 [Xylona heveae TC161]|uniref:separase n=1 Tax=Xylona heveae (strain CBS 132557 / TC161) TaxID=1328760 RepID=A0A165IL86_XYLHT|nr:hypothetical protein L228DRAFT_280329 [Xylona heveae TC161]KZF25059.1 hypothetical protein L228DRAFT_280329 [Xylona heveae TC161]
MTAVSTQISQARIDAVKDSLAAVTSCPKTAYEELESLLNITTTKSTTDTQTQRPRSRVATSGTASSRNKTTRPLNGRAKTGSKIADLAADDKLLTPRQRLVLATETVNITLKSLTEAIRLPPSSLQQNNPNATRATRENARGYEMQSSSPSTPRTPISRSLNTSTAPTRPSSSASVRSTSGLLAVAQSARLAFAYLRTSQADNGSAPNGSHLQLEHGMLALIGKLQALGLDDLASKELRILKRRLQLSLANEPGKSTGSAKDETKDSVISKTTLTDLLNFEDVKVTGQVTELVIGLQLAVLKLIGSSRRPSLIVAALNMIQLSQTNSPANLMLRSISLSSNDKVARQLEMLSQLLLSLCPSICRTEDENASNTKFHVSPETALQIQSLAFEIRLQWWSVSGHQGNSPREILNPFLRCLSTFVRRSSADSKQKYDLVSVLFERLASRLESHDGGLDAEVSSETVALPPILSIYKVLSSLAQGAVLLPEAIKWTREMVMLGENAQLSDARKRASAIRLTTLQLYQIANGDNWRAAIEGLSSALKHVESSLKGDATDIDDMLLEVAGLRKAAMEVLMRRAQSPERREASLPPSVQDLCEHIVYSVLGFLRRYLGPSPGPDANTNVMQRHEQRRRLVEKTARMGIDSAVALAKIAIAQKRVDWDQLEPCLGDCYSLLMQLQINSRDDGKASDPESKGQKQSPFVRLSNVYWALHAELRGSTLSDHHSKSITALQRSVDALKEQSAAEKESGLWGLKLERLAAVYQSIGKLEKSSALLVNVIQTNIAAGTLLQAASAAATKNILDIWNASGQVGNLGRAVVSLTKLAIDGNEEALGFFTEICVRAEEKGVLFEWALRQVQLNLESTSTEDGECRILNTLAGTLLRTYDAENYPVRRMRVIANLLQMESFSETFIEKDMLREMLSGSFSTNECDMKSRDAGLARYSTHLTALVSILSAFRNGELSSNHVQKCLDGWDSLVYSASDYQTLESKVTDIGSWLEQLQFLADYFGMKGLGMLRCHMLRVKVRVRELRDAEGSGAMVSDLCNLGLQFLHLGYSDKAGSTLAKAQAHVKNGSSDAFSSMRWHLAYAEYILELGNVEKCGEMLESAGSLFRTDDSEQTIPKPSSLEERIKFNRLIADASLVCSLQCFTAGALDEAIIHAKRSLRLNHRAWACLENAPSVRRKADASRSNSGMDGLSEAISQVSMNGTNLKGVVRSTTHEALKGPKFWTLVPSLYRAMTQLAQLYSYHGFLNEAIYYTEQAQHIVDSVQAISLAAHNQSTLGEMYLRGGRFETGQGILGKSKGMGELAGKSKELIQWHCSVGALHRFQGNFEGEVEAYKSAQAIFDKLTDPEFVNQLDGSRNLDTDLAAQMDQLSLQKPSVTKKPAISRSARPATRRVNQRSATEAKKLPSASKPTLEDYSILQRLKGDVLRRKALTMLAHDRIEMAEELLLEAANLPKDLQGIARHNIAKAKQLAKKGLEQMLADPVFCVLPDSTISVPSVSLARAPEKKTTETTQTKTRGIATQRSARTAPSTRRARSKAPVSQQFADILSQACDAISEVQELAMQRCSSSVIHELLSTFRSTIMLLYAASWGAGQAAINPLLIAQSMEIGRNIALSRDKKSLLAEKQSLTEDAWKWPKSEGVVEDEIEAQSSFTDLSAFQRDFIDIIPSNWTAISIALNETRDELYVSRLRAGETPFIIRLPLDRHNSRDAEEMVFNFDDGKAELAEIIELANFSTHSARAMTSKGEKAAWWAEREALDSRLHELLMNIENIWLGGFRGVFSQQTRHPELLGRFQQSFENSLNKHLPSRLKKGKAATKITLDPRILELFVGLQRTNEEEEELDEPLTDLLYFVVDILQFHGERNAYDEIDFDSLVVETQDALRAYHRTAEAEADNNEQHTILILDKTLHSIPWESLPCLSGLSVSRLPSLGSLRDRIQDVKKRSAAESEKTATEDLEIDGSNGAFILNPGGDLSATQAAFEAPLNSLRNWSSIVKRDPTTTELESILSSRDIFLYFGHGSASQYISLRSVKKLDRCAVAFLMGCSSGNLTETGEFEPYGTPISYMQAGSPALVATLWDVTDKDIDRFASGTLERWGLLSQGACQIKPHPKQPKRRSGGVSTVPQSSSSSSTSSRRAMGMTSAKSKAAKAAMGEKPKKKESLVRAVAQARNDCYLRYLNGAAPVVYGVPVYLS